MSENKTLKSPDQIDWDSTKTQFLQSEQDAFLKEKSLLALENHIEHLQDYCRKHQAVKYSDLTASLMEQFLLFRTDDRSQSTIKNVVWALRKWGEFLQLKGFLPSNPAENLKFPKISPRKELPVYLNAHQVEAFLKAASARENTQDFIVVTLLISTGMRPSEIEHLRWEHVFLQQCRIDLHVKGQWVKKTPMNNQLTELLRSHKLTTNPPNEQAPVFINKHKKPLRKEVLRYTIKEIGKEANISTEVTPKLLRHSYATHLADRNDKTLTRALLGHRFTHTSEVYTHLSPSYFRVIMSTLR